MAATLFLDNGPFARGEAFGPEAIETMAIAYEKVCNALGLVGRPSQLNELIARNIIELATCGVYDAERLSAFWLSTNKRRNNAATWLRCFPSTNPKNITE